MSLNGTLQWILCYVSFASMKKESQGGAWTYTQRRTQCSNGGRDRIAAATGQGMLTAALRPKRQGTNSSLKTPEGAGPFWLLHFSPVHLISDFWPREHALCHKSQLEWNSNWGDLVFFVNVASSRLFSYCKLYVV